MRRLRIKNKKLNMFFIMLLSLVMAALPRAAYAGITMSLDRNMLDFRTMDVGETRELADQGAYHNQITCTSTNSKTWYIKAHLVRPFTSGANTVPNENFKWMVVSTGDGKGIVYNNVNIPNSFTSAPNLIYTSDDVDNTGTDIKLQFRYILTIPKNQVAGSYNALIRLTMTETL